MNSFSLDKVNRGARAILRNGKAVTTLLFCPELKGEFKLVGVVEGKLEQWTYNGLHWGEDPSWDLEIVPDRCEGWVNVYRNTKDDNLEFGSKIYKDYTDAENNGKNSTLNTYICTIRIAHEE